MKQQRICLVLRVMVFLAFLPTGSAVGQSTAAFTPTERRVLEVTEGIIQLFRSSSGAIWPGFDLSRRPFIIYIPDTWALLLNHSGPVEGFTRYPEDWPELGTPVLFHQGRYKDLIGQLAFNEPIGDSLKIAAIGFPKEILDSLSSWELFGSYVHEAFHQYQSEMFGEIQWAREERYPILEVENSSLAYLEMRLLEDALLSMNDEEQTDRDVLRQFAAVRSFRWTNSGPFVPRYEQGQDIREGTARYVEMKSIALAKDMFGHVSSRATLKSLERELDSLSFPGVLLADLHERMTGTAIAPEDVARNRIYPVGAALGFLLDEHGVEWKKAMEMAGPDVSFHRFIVPDDGLTEQEQDRLVREAMARYDYGTVVRTTDSLIREYREGFDKELAAFNAREGVRIEVSFTTRSISRSRSSRAKQWIVDNGSRSYCSMFNVFSMKTKTMLLQVTNTGVLQNIDWDARTYDVTLYAGSPSDIVFNGTALEDMPDGEFTFQTAGLTSPNTTFRSEAPGTYEKASHVLRIKLRPSSPR